MLNRLVVLVLLFSPVLAQTPDAPPPDISPNTSPGTLLSATPSGVYQAEDIAQLAATLFADYGVPPLELAVEAYDLRYLTTDLDGSSIQVSAQLFVPVYLEATSRPLFAVGSGTTGIADKCAPSREDDYSHPIGHYRANMLAYASRGLITVFPDYLGFETPTRTQAYFNALAEARILLDAARATQTFFEQNPRAAQLSGQVFTGGYSQGGHAAFAAADLRPSYAPEIELAGAIGYGATTDVEALLREGPYYAPYIVESYRNAYGETRFDPAKILAPRWLPTLREDVGARCVDEAQQYYPFDVNLMYTSEFAAALVSGTLATDFPDIHQVLTENHTGLSGHGLPGLVVQGEDDIIVRNPTQERFVQQLCAAGSDVLYLNFPDVRHRNTRQVGFEETVAWINGISRSEAAPSSCSAYN